MASAELSRRVGKVVAYPPLSDTSDRQRREFHEALLEADTFDDLPGKWQAGDPEDRREPAEAAGRRRRLVPRSPHTRASDRGAPLLCMEGGSDGHRGCFCANAAFHGSLMLAASCSPPLDARQSLPRGGRRACSYLAERWACERRGLARVPLGQPAHGHRGAWRSRSRGLRSRFSCLARSTRWSPITTARGWLRGRAAGHANEHLPPGSHWAPGKGAK